MMIRSFVIKPLFCMITCLFILQVSHAQYIYKIKADTVKIYNTCDTAELVLQNRTRNVSGFLYNKGLGVTEFRPVDWSNITNIPTGGIAPAAGSANYIQNQTAAYQTANFIINGNGTAKQFQVYTPTVGAGGGISLQEGGNIRYWINTYNNKLLIGGNGGVPATAPITIAYNGPDSANVGINTASPAAKLHVTTTTGAQVSLFLEHTGSNFVVQPVTAGGTVTQINNTGGGGLAIQNIANKGNVGIGMLPGSSARLSVNGAISTTTGNISVSSAGGGVTVYQNASGTAILSEGSDQGITATTSSDGLAWVTGANKYHIGTNGSRRLTVDGNGNVGIGTTTPSQKFDIETSDASNTYLQVSNGTVTTLIGAGGVSGGVFGTFSAHPMLLYAGSAEKARLTAAGNLGIGIMAPTHKLDVVGDISATSFISSQSGFGSLSTTVAGGNRHYSINATDNTSRWSVGTQAVEAGSNVGSDFTIFRYADNGTSLAATDFVIKRSTGNVGIGTATPTAKLNINGDILATDGIVSNAGFAANVGTGTMGSYGHYNIRTAAGVTRWAMGTQSNETGSGNTGANFTFFRYADNGALLSSTDLVILRSSGNIGIGTATPAYKLDVSGTIQATGFYQASLRSLKKNIQPFNKSSLDILGTVKVRTFEYKADATNTTHIGFIADEVPDEMASPGHKGVDQANTVALLVKAMQEMNASMEQQQQQVADLKKQVTDLQQQLKEVKSK